MRDDFLPTSRSDMRQRGWDDLDIILVTGDAYVDHPAFGTAVIGRILASHGYRVGVIAQPDWRGVEDFMRLGRPRLFFGITSGNIDSMVANYTANKRPRQTDDLTPGGTAGRRPDRALIVYANRIRQAYKNVAVVIGGIEASTRRLAHYDYWDNRGATVGPVRYPGRYPGVWHGRDPGDRNRPASEGRGADRTPGPHSGNRGDPKRSARDG